MAESEPANAACSATSPSRTTASATCCWPRATAMRRSKATAAAWRWPRRWPQRDPANAGWQRDLSVSHDRVGEVLERKGDLDAALESFRAGLAIAEALTRREPRAREWQWDLRSASTASAMSCSAKGKAGEALASYRRGLEIAEALVELDPARTGWQRDLAVSYHKVGSLEAQRRQRERGARIAGARPRHHRPARPHRRLPGAVARRPRQVRRGAPPAWALAPVWPRVAHGLVHRCHPRLVPRIISRLAARVPIADGRPARP